MKSFFVLIYMLLSSSILKAEDWSLIYRSNNPEELVANDSRLAWNHRVQRKCLFERETQLFPEFCFIYLDQLIEQPVNLSQAKLLKKEVNELCALNAEKIRLMDQARKVLESSFITDNCKTQVKNRMDDLLYMEGGSLSGLILEKHIGYESINSPEIIL